MNETQEHLLKLLVELDKLCDEHGLTYYLAGGCAIGAFRHRGFLPWDDDADILMPLDDAKRLKELEKRGLLPPNRAVIGFSDFGTTLIWRYVDTSTTTFFRGTYAYKDYPNGQFVDILTMSSGPQDEEGQKRFVDEFQVTKNIRTDWTFTVGMTRRARIMLKRRWNILSRLLGRKVVSRFYQRRLFCDNWQDSRTLFVSSPDMPQFLEKELLEGETMRLPFETAYLNVYNRTKEGLALTYGSNWVEIPRSSSVRSVSHMILTDQAFSYPCLQRDINKISNFTLVNMLNRGAKASDYKNAVVRYDVSCGAARIELALRAHQYDASWKAANVDLDLMERMQEFTKSREVFSHYFETTKWQRLAFMKEGIPLNDDSLWAAWYPQMQRGNYLAVLKAIQKARPEGAGISDRLQSLVDACTDADEAMLALWTIGDYDEARKVLEKHREDLHPSIVFVRGFLAVDYHDAQSNAEYEAIHAEATKALNFHPGDGELLYWDGMALLKLGKRDEAIEQLKSAADHAVNGIIRLMAGDILKEEFGL